MPDHPSTTPPFPAHQAPWLGGVPGPYGPPPPHPAYYTSGGGGGGGGGVGAGGMGGPPPGYTLVPQPPFFNPGPFGSRDGGGFAMMMGGGAVMGPMLWGPGPSTYPPPPMYMHGAMSFGAGAGGGGAGFFGGPHTTMVGGLRLVSSKVFVLFLRACVLCVANLRSGGGGAVFLRAGPRPPPLCAPRVNHEPLCGVCAGGGGYPACPCALQGAVTHWYKALCAVLRFVVFVCLFTFPRAVCTCVTEGAKGTRPCPSDASAACAPLASRAHVCSLVRLSRLWPSPVHCSTVVALLPWPASCQSWGTTQVRPPLLRGPSVHAPARED